ncbi:M14 family metallopeptidase [Paenibacillus cymbidii]|uniref:M14 family metallopeptidase n=1 Tax=Paenibacillus cymbidii TaxID=1639034 RepID=UPI0010820E00|nr:M14 family metallopeptidase [Paenibacillus cymbidii]
MARKLLFDLRVKAEEGAVRLYFGKTTPLFQSDPGDRDPLVIRIYRKEEPAFEFGRDYGEYFIGLDVADAELIYEGRLEAVDARMYSYTDRTVKVGGTYAYWVSGDRGDIPVGPVPVRLRDTEIWWPQAKVERYMERLAATYADQVATRSFGRTIRGRTISGLFVGNMQNCIALVGLVHAGEAGPELILPAIERLLREHADLLRHVGVAVLPSVNIDMRELQVLGEPSYLRTNYNGVDINRNFPANWETIDHSYGQDTSNPHVSTYRGEAPSTEPETQALMAFIRQTAPRGVFSFHSLASICGDTFLTSKYAAGDSEFTGKCLQLIKAYSHGFALGEAYKIQFHYGCRAGSLPHWLYAESGIPGFDLEWDRREQSKASLVDETTRQMLEEYQTRHYHGIASVLQWLHEHPAEQAAQL